MAVLGLDLGTSAVKALLVPDDGGEPVVAAAPCPLDAPRPGWAEADPRAWLAAAGTATRAALARAPGESVTALGLAGQMHGVVLAGRRRHAGATGPAVARPAGGGELSRGARCARGARAAGQPARPGDGRAAAGLAGRARAGGGARGPVGARAEGLAAPRADGHGRDRGRATPRPPCSGTCPLTAGRRRRWPAPGVDPSLLPPLVPSAAPAGTLSAAGAAALGLPAGLPVHAGAADVAAALVGAGVAAPGGACSTWGRARSS